MAWLTQDDLNHWDARHRVAKKRAHAHLSDMRREMDASGEDARRIDDDELVLNYVRSRPDAQSLVGCGIHAVWARFLFSSDPNTRLPHVPGRQFAGLETLAGSGARFDWVLERVDGSAVRIHPSSNSHGAPVFGRLEQWLPPSDASSAPAATRGEDVMRGGQQGGFLDRHQVDVLGRADAQKFLEASLRTWEARPHPRGQFSESLLDGSRFPWWLYLSSTEWGRQLSSQVEDVGLCWLTEHDRPGFYVRASSGDGIIDPSGARRVPFRVVDLNSVASFE